MSEKHTKKRAGTTDKAGTPAPRHSRTDWARLRAMSDEEIEANAEADESSRPLGAAAWADAAVVQPERKVPVTIRVDPDVLTWFKGSGPRYQSRMNAVLRAYMEHNSNSGRKR